MIPTAADQPRWVSSPGDTIASLLHDRGLSLEDLADRAELSDPDARRILTGELTITSKIALVLHGLIGGSPDFWMRRSIQYTESLHWVQADDIASALPLNQLVEFGWLKPQRDWIAAAQEVLDYFDVADANEWRRRWGRTVAAAHYRAAQAFEPDEIAVAAWLRQVELRASSMQLSAWNPEYFREALQQLRRLTSQRDPQRFLPALQQIAASAGVAVVIERPPQGCSINGAVLQTADGRHVIGLTARYLADDQLWFTFFHEAGHLLHGTDGEAVLDDLDQPPENDAERAANDFARDIILNGIDLATIDHRDHRDIARAAQRLQIAPGLLVGQLQHADVIAASHFNRLRRRYQWAGTALVAAPIQPENRR